MDITITPWPRANHDEIAHLTRLARDPTATPGQQAIDTIARELDALLSNLPRYAVLARENGELTGWLLLVVQDATRVALNPWDLGGHPLVLPGHDRRVVGAGLVRAAAAWARDGHYEVLEVSFSRDRDPAVYETRRAWYASLGSDLREESVGFFWRLDEEPAAVALAEGVAQRPVGGGGQGSAVHLLPRDLLCQPVGHLPRPERAGAAGVL